MNLSELAIIYFALGAPLGVYHAVTHWSEPAESTFPLSVLSVCLWPVATLLLVYLHLTRPDLRGEAGDGSQEIAALMLQAAENKLNAADAFAVREVIARYTGICDAINSEVGTSAAENLADLTGAGHKAFAKACISRGNYARLVLHREDARREFVSATGQLGLSALAADLARSLADHEACSELGHTAHHETPASRSERITAAA